jgi:uncharacterized membrane protein
MRRSLSYFLQGLLALLPLFVSAYVAFLAFSFLEGIADNVLVLLPRRIQQAPLTRIAVEISAAALAFVLIAAFGAKVRTLAGRALLKRIEALLATIPGLSSVYLATKQVIDITAEEAIRLILTGGIVKQSLPVEK